MPRLALSEVENYSFYVKRSLTALDYSADEATRQARLSALAASPVTRQTMEERLACVTEPEALAAAMRRLRRDVMIGVIARDITGEGGYGEVVRTMTDLAEVTVSAAVRVHSRDLARRFGVPTSDVGVPQDLMAADVEQTARLRPAEDALAEHGTHRIGKERENVDAHALTSLRSGARPCARQPGRCCTRTPAGRG